MGQARKSRFGAHEEDGLAASHSGEYVPGKPETGFGTLCMQKGVGIQWLGVQLVRSRRR